MLDFRVNTFLCVCRTMNFTKAAAALHLTQPCVSQHIRCLEEYYGVKLFRYDNKTLRLTDAGRKVYNAILAFRHDEIHLKHAVQSAGRSVRRLRLGATLSVGEYFLPQRLACFLRHSAPVQVDFVVSDTQDLLARLDEGTIDMAMVEGFFSKESYDHILIKKEELLPVCGREYPIGKIRSLSDIFAHPLIVREIGSGTREVLERYLTENGYSIDRFPCVSTINSPAVILKFLEENLGISFLYRSVVTEGIQQGRLVTFAIPDYRVVHEFNCIWRKGSIFADSYRTLFKEIMAGGAVKPPDNAF